MNKIEFSSLKNREDMIVAFNQLKDDYYELFKENEKLEKIALDNERYKKYWTKCKADFREAITECHLDADIDRIASNEEKSYWVTAYNDMCEYDNEPTLDNPYSAAISAEKHHKLVESNMEKECYENNMKHLNDECLKYEKLYNDYHKKSQLLAKHYNDLALILTKGAVHPKCGYKFKDNEIIDKEKLTKIINEKYVIGYTLQLDDPETVINDLVREGEEKFYE